MKKICIYSLLFLLAACSIDNYDEPDAVLEGGIYDIATKGSGNEELVPGQAPDGARIRLYEENSSQPINFWCKTDGTFYNERVFDAEYKVIPEGPFITLPGDTAYVSIPTREKISFYVEPFLRVKKSVRLNGNKVEVTFTINQSENSTGTLNQYAVLYSWTRHVDISNYTIRHLVDVSETEAGTILGNEQTVTIDEVDTGKPIFVRVAARISSSNYYNYSPVMEL